MSFSVLVSFPVHSHLTLSSESEMRPEADECFLPFEQDIFKLSCLILSPLLLPCLVLYCYANALFILPLSTVPNPRISKILICLTFRIITLRVMRVNLCSPKIVHKIKQAQQHVITMQASSCNKNTVPGRMLQKKLLTLTTLMLDLLTLG